MTKPVAIWTKHYHNWSKKSKQPTHPQAVADCSWWSTRLLGVPACWGWWWGLWSAVWPTGVVVLTLLLIKSSALISDLISGNSGIASILMGIAGVQIQPKTILYMMHCVWRRPDFSQKDWPEDDCTVFVYFLIQNTKKISRSPWLHRFAVTDKVFKLL